MKLLLDENMPRKLRHHLPGHDVFTTPYMDWAGIGNGKLLALAADAGFEAGAQNSFPGAGFRHRNGGDVHHTARGDRACQDMGGLGGAQQDRAHRK